MTVAFKTFGCRLNRAETAQFEAGFAAEGCARVPFGEPADVTVFHTCAVTAAAESEGLKLIRAQRKKDPDGLFVLAGCAVEAAAQATLHALGVDLIVPRDQKDALVALVLRHLGREPQAAAVPPLRTTKRAALKVQDGCDFFCTYCIVPHTRGLPRSRPFDLCLSDARAFIDAGFQEIVVTGCNLACYADGARGLVDLLAALTGLPGLGRLRLGSVEPGTVEREVAALMAANDKLCPFLHLPIQSGDSGVLKRMGRRYTAEQMAETLREIVERLPRIGLGADLITGFPGESEEAFAHTQALAEAFPFSNLHVFPYSERPGTPAASFDGAVPEAERRRRAAALGRLRTRQREAFAQRFVGQPVTVLIEGVDAQGNARGWTGEYLECRVAGLTRDALAQLVACTPHAAEGGALLARRT